MPPSTALTLQGAIHWVAAASRDTDPLARLQTASALVEDLAEVGDAALGYFVDQARHSGHSWSEIGDALGVSKQAAQQKHMVRLSFGPNAPTLEHLTPRARKVITGAKHTARSWGHAYVGTEHLFLALYREPEGIGAQVLISAGLSQKKAKSAVAERVKRGRASKKGDVTYTPRAIAALSGALSSALTMGHNYIGTEHLLLGLAKGEGVAAKVLSDSGLTHEILIKKVETELAALTARDLAVKTPGRQAADKSPVSKQATRAQKARAK